MTTLTSSDKLSFTQQTGTGAGGARALIGWPTAGAVGGVVSFVSPYHVWSVRDESLDKPFQFDREPDKRGAGAMLVSGAVDSLPVGVALGASVLAAGPLLAEVQGQRVLSMAHGMADKLARQMRRDGRHVSEATIEDGASSGAAAVVVLLNQVGPTVQPVDVRSVCWRAVVDSMSSDNLGESVTLGDMSPDDLAGSALPLPGWYEDRTDRASRLAFERARGRRGGLLARRVEVIKSKGGRGRRADLVDKVHRAAVLLLHGHTLDDAAEQAGFKSSGRTSAGDRLAQAVRRLGCRCLLNARQSSRSDKSPVRPTLGAGLPAHVSAAWSFHPSAGLPGEDGRGGRRTSAKSQNPAIARHARNLRRVARRRAQSARAAAIADRLARRADRARGMARAAVRVLKALGIWANDGAGDWMLRYHDARSAARA